MNKPTALLVVAWLWIIIGILIIILYGGVAFTTMKSYNSLRTIETEMDVGHSDDVFGLESKIQGLYLLCFVMILIGIFSVVAGFYLLKLHNWARLSLEVFSWLGLIWYMFNFIRAAKNFTSLKSMFLEIQELSPIIPFAVVIIGIIFGLIYVAALIVSIILLRGKTVREAVKGRNTLTTSTDGGVKQVD